MTTKFFLLYLSGVIFGIYLFFVSILSNFVFVLGYSLSGWEIIGAIILSFLFASSLCKKYIKTNHSQLFGIIPLLVLVLGLVYGVAINRNIYDTSFDGQAYQGEAIATLIEGWNPILNSDSTFANEFVADGGHERWLNAYPKSSWYNSLSIYRLTGDFRDTKFFSMSVIISVFLVSLAVVNRFKFSENSSFDQLIKYLISFFITINPVLLLQSTTLNLDGQIYAFIVMLLGTMFYLYKSITEKSKNSIIFYVIIFILLSTMYNIKTAGLVYGLLFYTFFSLFIVITNHKEWFRLITTTLLSLVVGFGILGFNPYITNIQNYGNLLFPQFGQNSFDFTENTPSNFRDKKNVEIFLSSLFFKTDQVFLNGKEEPAEFKLPFTIYESEIESMKNSQLKKGGFGALFSGSLVLGFIAWLSSLVFMLKKITDKNILFDARADTKYLKFIVISLFVTSIFFISFVLTNTSNTFRYIPHLWLMLGIWFGYAFYSNQNISRTLASIGLLVGIINSLMFSVIYFSNQISNDKLYDRNLTEMRESGDSYNVFFDNHTPTRIILNQNKINYYVNKKHLECPTFRDDLKISPQGLINLTRACRTINLIK